MRLVRFLCALAALPGLSGAAQAAGEAKVAGAFETPARPLWAGEIFDLGFSWRVDWNVFSYLESPLMWDAPVMIEAWQGPIQKLMAPAGGTQLATISYRTRALVLQPGSLAIPPARQVIVLKTGIVRTMDYERAITDTVTARSGPASVDVRPLPPPPNNFLGAVGRFALSASVVPAQPVVGQRLTWTLTLSGMGNWPSVKGFPARRISRAFESAGEPRLTEVPGATMFEQTLREEVDLIPREAGRHVLDAVEMSIFDPRRGEYVTLSTGAISLDVLPDAAQAGTEGAAAQAKARRAAVLPPLLPGRAAAPAPMSDAAWTAALLVPFALVTAFWLLMALLRAYRDDPERLARRSHAQLGKTLRQLERAATEAERRRLVRSWQHHAGLRWKLNRAAPVPASFSGNDAWRELWTDADLFLYGRSASLPADWVERAQLLRLEQGRPPGFKSKTVFSRRNLYPLALMIGLAAMAPPAPLTAAGEGSAAQSFAEKVERHPLDWKARHNLAVSLAARDRWNEAAAHAGIVWVQHPSADATRTLWRNFSRQAGFPQGADNNIPLPSGWWGHFVSAVSPPQWQWALAASGIVAALGSILLLFVLYGHAGRRWKGVGFSVVAAGAIGVAASGTSLRTYGALADSEAVVVWQSAPLRPLPVETPPEAETVVLGAGSAARVDGHFLGWRRLRLSDGRSGWVRDGSLVWAWR